MNNTKEKVKGSIKENWALMKTPLMSILPGQISFFVVLSIIPLASIFIMFLSKLSINLDAINNYISMVVPMGASNIIIDILNEQKAGAVDIFFIITAFYLASKATHSIIVASTRIYNGEQRNFVRTRIKAIIMLLILVILVVLAVGTLLIGGQIFRYLMAINDSFNITFYWIYKLIKWPFVVFMIFYCIKVIYTIAPNVKIPSKSVNKGALLTTLGWAVSTFVYSTYVTKLANYSRLYGNLTNLILLMIWIYILSYTFVFGMTLNENKLSNKKSGD